MLIPLSTDRPPRRRPVIVQSLIILNMLVYLGGLTGTYFKLFDWEAFLRWTHFDPQHFKAWQLLTYQFMHDPGSIWHLAFNMLFLWVFGTAVEDRLGRGSFLAFYLMAGCVAGLAHAGLQQSPVIGASGAVAGVTGGFLALFPRSRIRLLFFFLFIGVYSIPSLWFIGLYFVIDLLRTVGSHLGANTARVAYEAHLAGYLYGFLLAFTLLATGIVKREEFDVFYLFKQARRRAAFRTANKATKAAVWDSPNKTEPPFAKKQAPSKPPSEQEQRIAEVRAEVNRLVGEHDLEGATKAYERLIEIEPEAVLIEQRQLDVANQLFSQSRHTLASRAYELFLKRYPRSGHAAEVSLILGVLYARHLNKPQRAIELVKAARERLVDAAQKSLADQLIGELAT